MNSIKSPAVVAFDFDGTLTRADTLVPFLRSLVGARRTAQGLIAAQWVWRPRNEEGRARAKRALIRTTTRGISRRDVAAAGEQSVGGGPMLAMAEHPVLVTGGRRPGGGKPIARLAG